MSTADKLVANRSLNVGQTSPRVECQKTRSDIKDVSGEGGALSDRSLSARENFG